MREKKAVRGRRKGGKRRRRTTEKREGSEVKPSEVKWGHGTDAVALTP